MAHDSTSATPTYLPVPDVAELLGVVVTKVHQLLRERTIIAVRRDGILSVPGEFIDDGGVVRGLTGTITLLTDAGFGDEEIIEWLYSAETGGSRDGTAMADLRSGRIKDVHRRAQIAGY